MAETSKRTCFAIAPIGPKDSEIRKRSDQVLRHIFKRALAEKYEVTRGDEIDEPGMITSQVLRAVQDSDLVVADLTGHNANVLYELAVRHAIEKPVIHVIQPSLSKIPFDIAGFRTIEFELSDPDSIESAVEQLKKHADAAENGHWGETPVKLANITRPSRQDSENTVLLKETIEGIAALRTEIGRIPFGLADTLARMETSLNSRFQHQIDYLMNLSTPPSSTWMDAAADTLGGKVTVDPGIGGALPSAKSATVRLRPNTQVNALYNRLAGTNAEDESTKK